QVAPRRPLHVHHCAHRRLRLQSEPRHRLASTRPAYGTLRRRGASACTTKSTGRVQLPRQTAPTAARCSRSAPGRAPKNALPAAAAPPARGATARRTSSATVRPLSAGCLLALVL